ncbi:MAG: tetratricopeptide repeat protein [Firmicutes bacterium]|nr:tetratricopeptide repeat protein [Bacillota bacterium]
MKKIKIFLASSIVEFARERDELELFIRNVSDRFEDSYDTKIIPLRCENVDTRMALEGKQEEFNQLIRESEMCFFIFFTRVGDITRREFDVAFERFTSDPDHKPQIYVYFKSIPEGVQVDDSVREFMDAIDKTYKHYYSNFSNIDTIKLRILLNLKMQEMEFVKVEIKGDRCLVDNADVLNLSNVSEFANSKELSALNVELQSVEEQYMQMQPLYRVGGFSEEFRREYVRLTARRQHLKEMIDSLKKSIFELSLNLSRDEVRGELTPRQREAYRLLESGDSKGCLSVLDADDIDDEFERFEREQEAESRRKAEVYVREHKLAIDVLQTMYDYEGRFAEIDKRFEKIVATALKYKIELSVLYDYAFYYHTQNEYDKALIVAEEYRVFCENPSYGISDYERSRLYSIMGRLYRKANKRDLAETFFLRTISIREKLAEINSEYKLDLASVYQNIGVIYNDTEQYGKAEKYLVAAQRAFRSYSGAVGPDNPFVARNFNALGKMYAETGRYAQAEQCFEQSLEFCRVNSQITPHCFEFYWGVGCNAFGEMYLKKGDYDDAEQRFLQATAIRSELSAENPSANDPYLVESVLNLARTYEKSNRFAQAKESYERARKIYERLAETDSEKYLNELRLLADKLAQWKY